MNEPTLLYVSDDPESVTSHGQLFSAPVPSWSVVRFLFDHVNLAPVPLRIACALVNSATSSGAFSLLGACAGPDANGMQVGHLATERFLRAKELVTGGAVSRHSIAANRGYMLADFVVPVGACIAGIYDVATDPGTRFELRAFACDPSHDTVDVWPLLPQSAPSAKQRRGVFDITGTAAPQTISYTGASVVAQIGSTSLPRVPEYDPSGGLPYIGDYGVLRRFDMTLSCAVDRSVSLYESAHGGSATATFILDGRLRTSSQIAPGRLVKVASFAISAGITVTSSITTMAEINSSYPLDLTIGADDPTIVSAGAPGSLISIAY